MDDGRVASYGNAAGRRIIKPRDRADIRRSGGRSVLEHRILQSQRRAVGQRRQQTQGVIERIRVRVRVCDPDMGRVA